MDYSHERGKIAQRLDPGSYAGIFDLCGRTGRRVTVFDTETSGFVNDPRSEILELAFLNFSVDEGILYGCWIIRNEYPIGAETSEIHGLNESICATGYDYGEMWNYASPYFSPRDLISGFNSREFDMGMLEKCHGRHGIAMPGIESLDARDIHISVTGTKRGRLTELCERNGIAVVNAHQAMADAIMAAGLLEFYIQNLGVARVMASARK